MKEYIEPLCQCSAEPAPHPIGDKCDGLDFISMYHHCNGDLCLGCPCYFKPMCTVVAGEDKKEKAKCWEDAMTRYADGEIPTHPFDF